MVIHLDTALPRCSCCQPRSQNQANPAEFPRATSIRHCSRRGLPCGFRCRNPGGLLPHLFTLASRGRRSVLCGAFPRVSPAGRYPAPLTCGVRTFLTGASPRDHPAVRTIQEPSGICRIVKVRRFAGIRRPIARTDGFGGGSPDSPRNSRVSPFGNISCTVGAKSRGDRYRRKRVRENSSPVSGTPTASGPKRYLRAGFTCRDISRGHWKALQ